MTRQAGDVRTAPTKEPPPRLLVLGFGMLLLAGLAAAVAFAIIALSRDWTGFNAEVARDLASRKNGAAMTGAMTPLLIGSEIVSYVLALVLSLLPILFGWLTLRGRKWARIVLTVLVALPLVFLVRATPYALVFEGVQVAATVLIWLPSSTAFITAEGKRRRSNGTSDVNLAPLEGIRPS